MADEKNNGGREEELNPDDVLDLGDHHDPRDDDSGLNLGGDDDGLLLLEPDEIEGSDASTTPVQKTQREQRGQLGELLDDEDLTDKAPGMARNVAPQGTEDEMVRRARERIEAARQRIALGGLSPEEAARLNQELSDAQGVDGLSFDDVLRASALRDATNDVIEGKTTPPVLATDVLPPLTPQDATENAPGAGGAGEVPPGSTVATGGEEPEENTPKKWPRRLAEWSRNQFAPGGPMGRVVAGYRNWREKKGYAEVEGFARVGASGATALWASGAAANAGWAQSALLSGYLPYTFGLIPATTASFSAIAAVPSLPIWRRGVARWLYEGKVRKEFEDACREAGVDPETVIHGRLKPNLNKDTEQILDSNNEQKLILAFHKIMRSASTHIPYLHDELRYVRFCYGYFLDLCKQAYEYREEFARQVSEHDAQVQAAIQAGQPPPSPPRLQSITGLTSEQQELLAKYWDPQDEDDYPRENVQDVASAYGRLLANQQREKTQAQLTGATIGTAAGLALSLSSIWPAVVGGAALGARRLYRYYANSRQHLEISKTGELQGKGGLPIVSPEVQRGEWGTIYRTDVLMQYKEESQLSDDEKRWLPKIIFPEKVRQQHYSSPQELAKAAAPAVQEALGRQKGFAKKIDEEERTLRKDEWQRVRQRADAIDAKLEQKQAQLDDAIIEQSEQKGLRDHSTAKPEDKARASARYDMLTERIDAFSSDVFSLTSQLEKLQEREEKAKKEYDEVRKPKEPEKELGAEAVGQNMEIIRAFSVKVHQVFNAQQLGWKGKAMQGGMSIATSGPVKGAVQLMAAEGGKVVGVAGIGAATGGGAMAILSSIYPNLALILPSATTGALAGGGAFLLSYLWKRVTGAFAKKA